jgi:hypothetical protein
LLDSADNNGDGATVLGIINYTQIRNQKGYVGLFLRTNKNGSASLLLQTTAGYTWLAVAGAGGYGLLPYGGGGDAGSAIRIGQQGGRIRNTHSAVNASNGQYIYTNMSIQDEKKPLLGGSTLSSQNIVIKNIVGQFVSLELEFSVNIPTIDPILDVTVTVLSIDGSSITYPLVVPNLSDPAFKTYTFTCVGVTCPGIPFQVVESDEVIITLSVNPGNSLEVLTHNFLSTNFLSYKLFIQETSNIGDTVIYGGGGGVDAVGQIDGKKMQTDAGFVLSHEQTGGIWPSDSTGYNGGDGYYGGGSGSLSAGGGGSYVSDFITQVHSFTNPPSVRGQEDYIFSSVATLTPLKLVPQPQPNFNIYSWVTRYNRLRINSGRGAIMFNETAL